MQHHTEVVFSHTNTHTHIFRRQSKLSKEALVIVQQYEAVVSISAENMSVLVGQDSVWGGTESSLLYQSNHSGSQQPQPQQQHRFETVTSGKKKKKQKMVRADPSLLGEEETPGGSAGKQHVELSHAGPIAVGVIR